MSCDYRRKKFLKALITSEPQLLEVMGCQDDPRLAVKALNTVYELGCNIYEGSLDKPGENSKNKLRCTSLFLEFQKKGIEVPTHAKVKLGQLFGLPNETAQSGYSKLEYTLQELRAGGVTPILGSALEKERLQALRTAKAKGQLGPDTVYMRKLGVNLYGLNQPENMNAGAQAPTIHIYENSWGEKGVITVRHKKGVTSAVVLYKGEFTNLATLEEGEEYLSKKWAGLVNDF